MFRIGTACSLILILCSSSLLAQGNGNGNNNVGGILIDAEGVLRSAKVRRATPSSIKKKAELFAKKTLSADMVATSEQRTISLREVEQAVQKSLQADEPLSDELLNLGGLLRIDHIIFEENDILISGPAEGFGPDVHGRMLGIESGRPPLMLDDLVVALRSTRAGKPTIGCSIDPAKENMARLQQYIRGNSNPTSSSAASRRFANMGQILGLQEVSLWGVPEDSHFAAAIVVADYRMKRISLGVEPSGMRNVRSHLSLLAPQGNSLQRWWFTPLYEPLEVNADRTVFHLAGQRAQLMAQEEFSDGLGNRSDAATTRLSTQKFAELFTEHFEELANRSPDFAQLQSLYDLSVLAALVKQEFWSRNSDWKMDTFLKHDELPVAKYVVPKFVPSASNFKKGSRGMLVGLIGGVTVDVRTIVRETESNPRLFKEEFNRPERSTDWFWNGETADEPSVRD